jgi:beta-lactamase class D
MMRLLASAFGLCAAGAVAAAPCVSMHEAEPPPSAAAAGLKHLAVLMLELEEGRCTAVGEVDRRHAPWSTFKIPHLLIALETGATTPNERFVRDPARFPAESWWSDAWREPQDPEAAFGRSTVWVYRTLTDRIADDAYRRWLQRVGYGNRDVGNGRDDFWLGGPLAVSVREQVGFVAALVRGETGVSGSALRALERASRQDVDFPYAVFGKTGAGPLQPGRMEGPFEGWFVGWLRDEQGAPVAAFALYATADSFAQLAPARRAAALSLVKALLAAR